MEGGFGDGFSSSKAEPAPFPKSSRVWRGAGKAAVLRPVLAATQVEAQSEFCFPLPSARCWRGPAPRSTASFMPARTGWHCPPPTAASTTCRQRTRRSSSPTEVSAPRYSGRVSRAGVGQAVRCVPEPLLASCGNSLLRGHRSTSLMLRSQRC